MDEVDSESFIARFWGTRGCYPVPGAQTVRYGGNTTCVEFQVGQHPLIMDAGTGMINLGYDLVRRARRDGYTAPIVATILLTHTHHDHTQGFPFFAPAHIGSSILHILGPNTFERGLEEALNHTMMPPNFPLTLHEMPSLKIVRTLLGNEVLLLDQQQGSLRIYDGHHDRIESPSEKVVRIRIFKSYAHPRNGVHVYRVEWRDKAVVFASDTEGYRNTDRRLAEFARGADLLIHDAQYQNEDYITKKQGWGHSTPEIACEVARLAGVGQLVLFHHEPTHNDEQLVQMEQAAQRLFPNTMAAYEGLEIKL